MPYALYAVALAMEGITLQRYVARFGQHPHSYELELPAGQAAQLTTRTNDTSGILTLDPGHGFLTGDIVDLHWTAAVRYGMTATVSGDEVTVAGGAGAVLPNELASLNCTKQVPLATAIVGNAVQIAGLLMAFPDPDSTQKGHVAMYDADDNVVLAIRLTANEPEVLDVAGGAANLLAGNPIVACRASNGTRNAAARLTILSLEN